MRLAKGVPGKPGHQPPNFLGLFLRVATILGTGEELFLDFGDGLAFLFVEGTPEHVGTPRRQAGICFADLENVFFVDDETKCVR